MGEVKKEFMAQTMDDMGKPSAHYTIDKKGLASNHEALGFPSEEAMLQHTPWGVGNYLSKLTEADMNGNYDVLPEIGRTVPLSKAEIAFKKKFEYRVKTVVKYLGRNLMWTEFNDLHETLTKELEEA